MKDKENQTPRKELPRSSDLIAQKCLAEPFISPEDVLPDISEESIDFSSISVISDGNYNFETVESFVMASCPSVSASLEAFPPSQLTPCSKMSTTNRIEQIDFSMAGQAEVDFMVNLLKQARLQALNSIDMDNKSKKVLDALIESTINDFYTLPQERDKLPGLVSRNPKVGFLCFLLWIVAFFLFSSHLFCYSRVADSFTGLRPT
ncbi:hypothetical protein DITRI_Ditri15bG0136400 [Diplodiscus trichospermus]